MLYNLAVSNSARISYGCEVVDIDPESATVTLKNGQTITADIVVGADGAKSLAHRIVRADELETAPSDPEIDSFDKPGPWNFYGYVILRGLGSSSSSDRSPPSLDRIQFYTAMR